ncbi:hypothetical protein V9T40_011453 [Parthenolecanium corni]|uniref:Endoplasmic reticulum-Golgi intermediate compartment protein 3 n=1 Tax=Parthenolecanium corni TaxID=536013 RepID=A0AAN9T5E6_9HEMI
MTERSFASFINKFKFMDVFTKPLDDFQEKTLYGGLVTVLCWITIYYLALWECLDYLKTTWKEEIFVDVSSGSKININLDIIVSNISCDYLALDAVDSSGDQHLHIDYNIYKRRLDVNGNPLEDPRKESIPPVNKKAVISEEKNSTNECGSCYGAGEADQCCNTCLEVKEAYRKKNWQFRPSGFIQCQQDATKNSAIFQEACQLYGSMEVNRVAGSFHIAPGQSFSISHIHVHDVQPYASDMFNTTHHIKKLSFGTEIDSALDGLYTSPLDGHIGLAMEGAMMFNYYIKLVPTIVETVDGKIYHTNQFSVTKFEKRLTIAEGDSGMPGIFFSYELSPLMVKRIEQYKPFGHLVMTILGYVSGVYIAALLIDSIVHKIVKFTRKFEIGKMS